MPRFYRATLEPGFEELLAVVLSPRELDLYSKLKGERRRRSWLVGRLAAKALLLGAGTALDPRDVEVLPDGRGVPRALLRGEPLPLSLSIAHSRREPEGGRLSVEGFAGLADLEGEGHIGVDLERVRPLHPRLVERAFHPEEREALCALKEQAQAEGLVARWALKEAAYKALGAAGLLPSPRGPGPGRGTGDTRGNGTETARLQAMSMMRRGPRGNSGAGNPLRTAWRRVETASPGGARSWGYEARAKPWEEAAESNAAVVPKAGYSRGRPHGIMVLGCVCAQV